MRLMTYGISNPKTAKPAPGHTTPIVNDCLMLAPATEAAVWATNAWDVILAYADRVSIGLGRLFRDFGRERAMGIDVCRSASVGCRKACLNKAGHGRFTPTQIARVVRTLWYYVDRQGFLDKLNHEIALRKRAAVKAGATYVFRPNATSDLPGLAYNLAKTHPDVQFYDYTAHPRPEGRTLGNYHLTFSRKESNARDVLLALTAGVNVTVVFDVKKGAPLPASYMGREVIDGDIHDLRFLDKTGGVIVGLRPKGDKKLQAAARASGFAVSCG